MLSREGERSVRGCVRETPSPFSDHFHPQRIRLIFVSCFRFVVYCSIWLYVVVVLCYCVSLIVCQGWQEKTQNRGKEYLTQADRKSIADKGNLKVAPAKSESGCREILFGEERKSKCEEKYDWLSSSCAECSNTDTANTHIRERGRKGCVLWYFHILKFKVSYRDLIIPFQSNSLV